MRTQDTTRNKVLRPDVRYVNLNELSESARQECLDQIARHQQAQAERERAFRKAVAREPLGVITPMGSGIRIPAQYTATGAESVDISTDIPLPKPATERPRGRGVMDLLKRTVTRPDGREEQVR